MLHRYVPYGITLCYLPQSSQLKLVLDLMTLKECKAELI